MADVPLLARIGHGVQLGRLQAWVWPPFTKLLLLMIAW